MLESKFSWTQLRTWNMGGRRCKSWNWLCNWFKALKEIINDEISERFDHRNLNLDCPEFANLKPSAENIAIVIYNILRPLIEERYGLTIRLWETENNVVEYNGKW